MKSQTRIIALLLALLMLVGMIPSFAIAAGSNSPVIGAFQNHKDNEKNRFTFTENALGQTVISYNTKTNWDIAEASVTGYTSEYTRLCVTGVFSGTKNFGIEVKVPGKSDQELRDASLALNKQATLNSDGSYTYDVSISQSILTSGITAVYLFLDPATSVSGTRSMTILDIGFRKAGESAYDASGSQPGSETGSSSSYDVSLSPTVITFPAADVGYGSQKTQTVTIKNTGSVATGSLSITTSGSNSGSFTVSKTNQTSIAKGGSGSFTVVPKTGLAVGTYSATVTVSNANVAAKTVDVSFTVNALPPPTISLSPTVITFPAADVGYGAQTKQTVTIKNTGTIATGSLNITSSGSNSGSFTVSKATQTSIAKGGSGSFTIVPKTGLAVGTYTATVTVSNANVEPKTVDVSFTVNAIPPPTISLSPTSITFPAADAGYGSQTKQTVTIENTSTVATGSLTIKLTSGDTGSFTLSKTTQTTIAKGKTGSFTIVPNKGLKAGTYTATVTVSNANVEEKTVDVSFTVNVVLPPSISLSPTSITFPTADVGYGAQTKQTVTIKNTGTVATGSLTIKLTSGDTGSFTLSKTTQTTIAKGGSGSFTVVPKTGLKVGTYSATVTVSNANVEPQTVDLSFTVQPLTISLSPSVITLPAADEGYGTQKAQTVTITNNSTVATGSLTIKLTSGDIGSFTLSKTTHTSIAKGKTGSFTIVPKTGLKAGTYTATVTVSNANVEPKTVDVSFTVNGKDPPIYEIEVTPASIAFPTVDEGYGTQALQARTITIKNTGNVPTGTLNLTPSGANNSTFTLSPATSLNSVGVNGTTTFNVVPKTGLKAGTYTDTVTVGNANVGQKPVQLSFTVNPQLVCAIEIMPASITFPEATVGYGQQSTQTVTVKNTGNVATGVITLTFSGANSSAFTLSNGTSLSSIAVGGSTAFTVGPTSGLAAGTYTATVTVTTACGTSKTVQLSFTVKAPPMCAIEVTPGTITFPEATVGYGRQATQPVTVKNIGNVATGNITIALSGTNRTSFTLSATSLSSIAVGDSRAFTVEPNTGLAAGTYTATVTVTTACGTTKAVQLSFTVKAPPICAIEVTPATITFPSVKENYTSQAVQAVTVTVRNIGTVATGNITLALSGANRSAFTLTPASSLSSIAVGGSASFTVKPNTGLAAGTYTATVTVTTACGTTKTVDISFLVESGETPPPNTYYVDKTNGNDSSGNGSASNPWKTIQNGINKMPAGSTLIIRTGVYEEKLSNIKSGTSASKYTVIKGETGAVLSGDSASGSGTDMITLDNKNYVRIENLEICNNRGKDTRIGIYVTGSNSAGIQLINNKIHDIDGESENSKKDDKNGHGILVKGSGASANGGVRDLLIEGNEVYDCLLGQSEAVVVNGNVYDWRISNNYIHNNNNIAIDAIGGEDSSTSEYNRARNGTIEGNYVKNNSSKGNPTYGGELSAGGIYVDGGRDIDIKNNYIVGSDYGIEIASENGKKFWPEGITVCNNVVADCNEAGVNLGGDDEEPNIGAKDVKVINNTIYYNKASYNCMLRSGDDGPYEIISNTMMTANNRAYVGFNFGTVIYMGNIYYGGSSTVPKGDSDGIIVKTPPVASLDTSSPWWFVPNDDIDAGANPNPFYANKWLIDLWGTPPK